MYYEHFYHSDASVFVCCVWQRYGLDLVPAGSALHGIILVGARLQSLAHPMHA